MVVELFATRDMNHGRPGSEHAGQPEKRRDWRGQPPELLNAQQGAHKSAQSYASEPDAAQQGAALRDQPALLGRGWLVRKRMPFRRLH